MDPFVGEIRPVPYNFAPRGWAFCQGQIMPIAQNTALFSLLGTTYGGNGQTTYALPNLQDRVPVGAGQGPGLSPYDLGQQGGEAIVTMTLANLPAHTHSMAAGATPATNVDPTGLVPAMAPRAAYATPGNGTLASDSVGMAGGSQPHNNMMPYLGISYVIALEGIYPPRN